MTHISPNLLRSRKGFLTLLLLLIFPFLSHASGSEQNSMANDSVPDIVKSLDNKKSITIHLPAKLAERLKYNVKETAALEETTNVHRGGYRILVFDDNNPRTAQAEAHGRKKMMESAFPELRGYVVFDSPYWKVKIGDFRSRGEAEHALERVKTTFPTISRSVRIIRDRINSGE